MQVKKSLLSFLKTPSNEFTVQLHGAAPEMVNLAQLKNGSKRMGGKELKASREGEKEKPELPLLLKERSPGALFASELLKGGIPELGAFSRFFKWFNAKHSAPPTNQPSDKHPPFPQIKPEEPNLILQSFQNFLHFLQHHILV